MSKLSEKVQEVLGETAEYWAQTLGGLPTGEAVSDWISEVLIPDILEIAQAYETEATRAAEQMRERAAMVADNMASANYKAELFTSYVEGRADAASALAAVIRALPTNGE